MRTTDDAERILYNRINGSALKAACNGVLCKWNRPDNSDKEDIVINSLPITTNGTQRMVANVNIFVKDLLSPVTDNHWMPDTGKLKTLAGLAMTLLEEEHGTDEGFDYHFFVTNQSTFPEPAIKQTYLNFRIEFAFYPV
jgi:hypothetical protein